MGDTMNLTRKEKDRIIKVLKKARPLIEKGEFVFVCNVVKGTKCIKYDIYLTINYIEDLIFPFDTVTQWLYDQYRIWLDDDDYIAKDYRLQWIDHMIKELKK